MEIKISAPALAEIIETAVFGEDELHEDSTMEEISEVLRKTDRFMIINTKNLKGIEIIS